MDIPLSLTSKFSPYEVEFQGKKVTTYVAYNRDQVFRYVNVISNLIQEKEHRIVGVDIKKDEKTESKLLILCISSHCLVIQLAHYMGYLDRSLLELMDDSCICFVSDKNVIGTSLIFSKSYMYVSGDSGDLFKVKGIELCFLVARMLKNPDLMEESIGLRKLADAAGVAMSDDMKDDIKPLNWSASVFTDEQMRIVIHDAYFRFFIASKLLGVDGDSVPTTACLNDDTYPYMTHTRVH